MIFNADIFRFRYRQERNYDFWLGLTAKFPLSENSDKIRLTELAKNQTFPLFMRFLWLTIASRVFLEPSHLRTKNTNTKFATTFMNGRITIYGNIHHATAAFTHLQYICETIHMLTSWNERDGQKIICPHHLLALLSVFSELSFCHMSC